MVRGIAARYDEGGETAALILADPASPSHIQSVAM